MNSILNFGNILHDHIYIMAQMQYSLIVQYTDETICDGWFFTCGIFLWWVSYWERTGKINVHMLWCVVRSTMVSLHKYVCTFMFIDYNIDDHYQFAFYYIYLRTSFSCSYLYPVLFFLRTASLSFSSPSLPSSPPPSPSAANCDSWKKCWLENIFFEDLSLKIVRLTPENY